MSTTAPTNRISLSPRKDPVVGVDDEAVTLLI